MRKDGRIDAIGQYEVVASHRHTKEPAIPGLRERKRADSRESTVDHAVRLFREHGYEQVTVADICAAAGIGRRTFFRYFATKDDVLVEPLRQQTAQVMGLLAAAPASQSARQALHSAFTELAVVTVRDGARFREVLLLLRDVPVARLSPATALSEQETRLAAALLARSDSGRSAREAVRPDWQLRLMVARSIAAYRVWLDDLIAGDLVDPVAHLVEILDYPES